MNEQVVLVTGGTGFVGSHLVEELLASGFKNVYVTEYSSDPSYVRTLLPADHILQLDLTNQEATFQLIEKLQPAWIFHLAAIAISSTSFEKASLIFQNNTSLQLNLLEAVRVKVPKARVLVVGSGMEYGMVQHMDPSLSSTAKLDSVEYPSIDENVALSPTNPYSVSKVTQDLLGLSYVHSYSLDVVRVRPFNHIGERQTIDFAIPAFASQIVQIERGKQEKIMVGSLDAVRDFSDVKDVVKAYVLLLEKGVKGEVYNVGTGQGHTMQTILAKMCSIAQVEIKIETDPARFRPVDVPVSVANIKKIRAIGWTPKIPLEDTLKRILDEWRKKE